MTDRSPLKDAFIAAVCGHPSAASYRERVFTGKNLEALEKQLAASGEKVTKTDFLACNAQGKYFLDSPQGWKNLGKIAKLLEQSGEAFTAADFLTPIGQRKTFIDSAMDHGGLAHIFSPDLWKGRYAEVEKLYHSIPIGLRRPYEESIDIVGLKRKLSAMEGKITREDRLAELRIDWHDFPTMFRDEGGIERLRSIAETLKRNGDSLKKEELFFPDADGDSMFFYKGVWPHFAEIAQLVAAGGERFEVDDFFRARGNRSNLIELAQNNAALEELFQPDIWENRIADMMELWSRMKPMQQAALGRGEFSKLLAQAEDRAYGGLLNLDKGLDIKDISQPIAIEGKVKIYPLGLSSTWENWDRIDSLLKIKGQTIKAGDLRQHSGYTKRSILDIAVHGGHLEKIVTVLRETNQSFQLEDLMQKDLYGQSLLSAIAKREELPILFTPKIWAGRVNDMKTLWAQLPIEHKKQLDWPKILNETHVATLNLSKSRKKPPKRRPR